VQVIYGAEGGLTSEGNQLWSQRTTTLPEGARAGEFSEALIIANFGQDAAGGAYEDLAIQTGGEGPSDDKFGGFLVLYGSAQGPTTAIGVLGTHYADLAIGSPFETLGRARSTGRVHVLYGTAAGLSADQVQQLDCRTFNRPSTRNAECGGQLGATGP
jgi:hypothetical protein